MDDNTITKDAIVRALQVLTGLPWERYKEEIFTGADNGDLLVLSKNPDLAAAGADVYSRGRTDAGMGYRIILKDGYDANKLIELAEKKILAAGSFQAVMTEWQRLKDEGSSHDPNAVREVTALLNVLYPDAIWDCADVAVLDPHACRREVIYSHALPKEQAEGIEQFLESVGIHPMVGLNIGSEEQEVGIAYFDAKAFKALKAAAEAKLKAGRASAPEFLENPVIIRNDDSLPIGETENPILLRATQIQAKTVETLGKLERSDVDKAPAA